MIQIGYGKSAVQWIFAAVQWILGLLIVSLGISLSVLMAEIFRPLPGSGIAGKIVVCLLFLQPAFMIFMGASVIRWKRMIVLDLSRGVLCCSTRDLIFAQNTEIQVASYHSVRLQPTRIPGVFASADGYDLQLLDDDSICTLPIALNPCEAKTLVAALILLQGLVELEEKREASVVAALDIFDVSLAEGNWEFDASGEVRRANAKRSECGT